MIREWMLPGLLETGPLDERIMAIQDGLVNFFVARGPEGLVCIDSGWRTHSVEQGFQALGLDVRDVAAIFLTHRHWDHARCADFYPQARVFAGAAAAAAPHGTERPDAPPRVTVRDGQLLTIAGLEVRVVETPGHTPDSICFVLEGRYLFTGDALRLRRGKVVPFPSKFNQDPAATKCSIRKLAGLAGIGCLLTAHTGLTRDPDAALQDWREAEE